MTAANVRTSPRPGRPPGAGQVVWVACTALLVFAVALISRIGLVDHPPIYDELYQTIPALEYLRSGTFAVLDGVYDRGALYTRMIATAIDAAGEPSVAAARFWTSAIPGAALVAVMFAWSWHIGGWVTAGITTLFLLFWPNGIEVSQYLRFYALQGLAFVVAAILVFETLQRRRPPVVTLVALAAAAGLLGLAVKLQLLTLIGIGALGLWVALYHLPQWLRTEPRLWWALGAALLLVAGLLLSGRYSEKLLWAWETYNWAPWPAQDDIFFYHRNFRDNYATFWPLFPVAALIALRANFRAASFCIVLFSTTLILQSFGGLKNIRYLYGTMPFFFLCWAIALTAVLPAITRYLAATTRALFRPGTPAGVVRGLTFLSLAIACLFVVMANVAVKRSSLLIAGRDNNLLLGKYRWEWREAAEVAAPWLADGALIATTEEMRTIQWLGDFDLAYSKPRFSEVLYTVGPDAPPFTADRRTGRPLIGERADMITVIECEPIGLFLADAPWMTSGDALAMANAGRASGAEVVLSKRGGMAFFGWQRSGPSPADPEVCATLELRKGRGAARRILSGESPPQSLVSARDER